jgi:hypothetical protein
MMDKTLSLQTRAMTVPLTMTFTLPMKSLMIQTRPITRKKLTSLQKIQMTKA